MINSTPSTLGDVKLSYRFILVGLISFVLYQMLFFYGIQNFVEGIYRVNNIWTIAHLFLLGFLLTIVMGVMYQLIPVALLVDIYSYKLARFQFWVYVMGVAGLAYGLWVINTMYMFVFGLLAFIGVLLFVINILLSTWKIKKWNMMSVIIVTAVFYFFITVLFGLGLVINFQFGIWNAHDQILYSHIIFGLVGWLTTLIIGFSYKMVPMFALSHGYSDKYAMYIYLIMQIGIISIVSGLFSQLNMLVFGGFTFIILALIIFAFQVKEIIKKKMKAKLDIGFKIAIYAVYANAVLVALVPIGLMIFQEAFILPFFYLFLNMWIVLSILGYLFKIVPFLWWTDKYSDKVGKENVPMLKDMVDEKRGKLAFSLIIIGMIGNASGIALHFGSLMVITNIIFTLGGILYSYLVLRIFKM